MAVEDPSAEGDDSVDTGDDVDLVLRHVTRQFPDELARVLLGLGPDQTIRNATFTETQLTGRQRRLDRSLSVLVDGEPCVVHAEWTLAYRAEMAFRVYEYNTLHGLALAAEAKALGKRAPPIESVVVVLSGPKRPLPASGEYRTSPKGKPFSGVRFRIERVYLRTIAELCSMGSPLWMIFAPLAKDADAVKLADVLAKLRAEMPPSVFTELSAAMASIADVDQEKRGLRSVIMSLVSREAKMRIPFLQELRAEGREEGRAEGRAEGLQPLLHQFERRLGRKLSADERARVVERIGVLGAARLGDVVLDLPTDALEAWLAAPDAA